ncbi:MAG: FtsX-like permease family protein [Thermotogae bacterium]|nr:FtsX-like permease family protein [Thermotogota bacterium]
MSIFITVIIILGIIFVSGLISNKILIKMAFRNIFRKKNEALLMMIGSMISMAFIIGALGLNDSFNNFVYKSIENNLGEIDYVIYDRENGVDADELSDMIDELQSEDYIDGVLPIYYKFFPVTKAGDSKKMNFTNFKQLSVVSFDYEKAVYFGMNKPEIPDEIKNLKENEVAVTSDYSVSSGFSVGDQIDIIQGTDPMSLLFPKKYTIKYIIDKKGIMNYRGFNSEGFNGAVYLNYNAMKKIVKYSSENRYTEVLISAKGDILGGNRDYSDKINDIINKYSPGYGISYAKADRLESVSSGEVTFVFIFLSVFAIIAGIVLLLNMYDMLISERKRELGILRAGGFSKKWARLTVFYESIFYTLFSVPFGVIFGIILSRFTFSRVTNLTSGLSDLNILSGVPIFDKFYISINSVLIGSAVGIILPVIITYFYTFTVNRLNIVNAIKDVKDYRKPKSKPVYWIMLVLGIILTLLPENFYTKIFGISLIMLFIPFTVFFKYRNILNRFIPAIPMIISFFYKSQSFIVLGEKAFIILFATIMLSLYNLDILTGAFGFLFSKIKNASPILKIALNYPVRNKRRTGMIITLYSLVIFVLVIMTVVPYIQVANLQNSKDTLFAGFDGILVNVPGDLTGKKLSDEEMKEIENLGAYGQFYFLTSKTEDQEVPLIVTSKTFYDVNKLSFKETIDEFKGMSDREIWQELYNNPHYSVVPEFYVKDNPHFSVKLGDEFDVKIQNIVTGLLGRRTEGYDYKIKIAAVISGVSQSLALGPIVSDKMDVLENVKGGSVSGYLFTLGKPSYIESVRSAFKEKGQFSIFVDDIIGIGMRITQGMVNIINSFLYFGLIAGIIGISITVVKSVSERKKTIGMMKSIGYGKSMIFMTFFIENSISIILGILIGITAGTVTSYKIYEIIRGNGYLKFIYPFKDIIIMAVGIYLVSILFTFIPSLKASGISAAEAMKNED